MLKNLHLNISASSLTMTAQKRNEITALQLELHHASNQFDNNEGVTLINILILIKILNA